MQGPQEYFLYLQGNFRALVDEQDHARLRFLRWTLDDKFRAVTFSSYSSRGAVCTVFLQQMILGIGKDEALRVGFKDGDRLNFRRENLEFQAE